MWPRKSNPFFKASLKIGARVERRLLPHVSGSFCVRNQVDMLTCIATKCSTIAKHGEECEATASKGTTVPKLD